MLETKKENTFYPLQGKNKPCDGETEHVFILSSIDCMVANKDKAELLLSWKKLKASSL
jgi:hypothetical protein